MDYRIRQATTLCAVLIICSAGRCQTPMDSSFTYQGQLRASGAPANAPHDFIFSLYDALEGGNLLATTGPLTLPVAGGLFTTSLDFGTTAFSGGKRWIETQVAPAGGGFTTLAPRIEVSPVPRAGYALSADTAQAHHWVQITTDTVAEPNTGYLVHADTLGSLTLTLPPSPQLGDIVSVNSIEGGWKIGQNPVQRIRTDSLTLSETYSSWTAVGPTVIWTDIASSANGMRLLASGSDSASISTDGGDTWHPTSIPTPANYAVKVGSSCDGTRLAACGSWTIPGYAWTGWLCWSADAGANWDIGLTGGGADWNAWTDIACSADGMKLAACAVIAEMTQNDPMTAPGGIVTSTNGGVSWTYRVIDRSFWSVAVSADATRMAAAQSDLTNGVPGSIFTSSDSG